VKDSLAKISGVQKAAVLVCEDEGLW
jgi:hypothetical protein